MRIALFSGRKNFSLSVAELVSESLRSRIFNLEVEVKSAENALDLVSEIVEAENFDIIAVILFYGRETPDIMVLMEKLVELDLKGKKTMKFLKRLRDDSDEVVEAEKISSSILKKIFGEKYPKEGAGEKEKESYSTL
ncbi:MAG TPA: hypothetical protein VFF09_01225 [archaeon]|nr:hypothetical protein [archaeon]